MEELIRIQRATVDEHIREENVHNWPAVYGTFVQDEGFAFYDVVALHRSSLTLNSDRAHHSADIVPSGPKSALVLL